ncbi:MAG: GNAT family N-acetyltransferase [Gaiella sp.]|nr:GNAT family N-acetyltransferase [Gaiella sp.]
MTASCCASRTRTTLPGSRQRATTRKSHDSSSRSHARTRRRTLGRSSRTFANGWKTGDVAVFVIADATHGEPLGLVELHLTTGDPALASLGYWLRAEARGRGFATFAVRSVAGWALDQLGVQRLQLTTAPDNIASQRVAERAGFTREGLLRGWMPNAERAPRQRDVLPPRG